MTAGIDATPPGPAPEVPGGAGEPGAAETGAGETAVAGRPARPVSAGQTGLRPAWLRLRVGGQQRGSLRLGWLRVGWLYLRSRRAPAAVALLAGLGAVVWAALYWRWSIAGGAAARHLVPLLTETGAAAIIAATTYGPFGEPEHAAGRLLPGLRLAGAVGLTATAIAALAAGSAAGVIPGGILAVSRDLAGLTGTGLMAAVLAGGAFAWAGPMAYFIVAETALASGWTTPWTWPARPPHDLGGGICAVVVFCVGLGIFALRGPRLSARD